MNLFTNTTWDVVDTGPSDAHTNMALDEVFLKRMQDRSAGGILRFYTWSRPSISVGYFQDVSRDLDLPLCQERGWSMVRRLTGGRAVFHDDELTYSIVLPLSDPAVPGKLLESYRYLSLGLLHGLRELGVRAELVSPRQMKKVRRAHVAGSPDCFASPSWYEISVGGKKIVGSAQRRMTYGILQQGSILISRRRFGEYYEVLKNNPCKNRGGDLQGKDAGMTSLVEVLGRPVPLERIKDSILTGFAKAHQIRFEEKILGSEERDAARELVKARYGRKDWIFSRKLTVFKGES